MANIIVGKLRDILDEYYSGIDSATQNSLESTIVYSTPLFNTMSTIADSGKFTKIESNKEKKVNEVSEWKCLIYF